MSDLDPIPAESRPGDKAPGSGGPGRALGLVAGWAWALLAGGGGGLLLWEKGPLPLTNGWFALFSGLSACPLTAWLLTRFGGVRVSGRVRFLAALFFLAAGRIALVLKI